MYFQVLRRSFGTHKENLAALALILGDMNGRRLNLSISWGEAKAMMEEK